MGRGKCGGEVSVVGGAACGEEVRVSERRMHMSDTCVLQVNHRSIYQRCEGDCHALDINDRCLTLLVQLLVLEREHLWEM